MRRTLDLTQGSAEWHAVRARHFCASEAPAMMGASPHQSRAALLRRKASGFDQETTAAQERVFRRGHEAEASARARAETAIGEELFPATVVREVDGLPLLASLDGLTIDGATVWEHKLWRADLVDHVERMGEPAPEHAWQLEHQLLVTGAERAVYTLSDGERWLSVTYQSRPERRAQLLAGWRQFAADLEAARAARPAAEDPAPTGRAPGQLPTLRIEVEGRVLASNLEAWRDGALAVIRGINRTLVTDQDFADAERTVKWAKEAEAKLEAAKAAALAQAAGIEQLFRAVDEIAAELRSTRLDLEKLVKARKEAIRREIQGEALDTVRAWWLTEAADLGGFAPRLPNDAAIRIAEAMKGRKTVATLRDAAQDAAAGLRGELGERIARARACLAVARRLEAEVGGGHLWPDLRDLIERGVEPDHLEAVLRQRITAAAQPGPDLAPPSAPPSPDAPTLSIHDIAQLITPLAITACGLEQLGFAPLAPHPAQACYAAADWPAMVDAMIAWLRKARGAQPQE